MTFRYENLLFFSAISIDEIHNNIPLVFAVPIMFFVLVENESFFL